MQINLSEEVKQIFKLFETNKKEVFLVGGSIRDVLLKKEPKDYDFTTNAKPEEVVEMCGNQGYKVIPTGIKFGTVTILINNESFEVTTYRADGNYEDGRRPNEVNFSDSLDEDLKRRDFTINAMAYNPTVGLVDNYNGINDLDLGIIRAVGVAEDRLREDFLRAFRAVRLANQLNMDIEKSIQDFIYENMELVKNVSRERINIEITKTLTSGNDLIYVELVAELLNDMLPELKDSLNTPQNHPYHSYNVGLHTVKVINNVENSVTLKLSALLHDMGKPKCKTTDEEGIDHFYGHNKESLEITKRFLKDLKFSKDIREKVERLVYYHDREIALTKKSIRRALRQVGSDIFLDLLNLKRADIKGQNKDYIDRLEYIENVEKMYYEIIEEKECFSLKDLAVNGKDLMQAGVQQGESIGIILKKLLDIVIDDPKLNEKETLLKQAKEIHSKV